MVLSNMAGIIRGIANVVNYLSGRYNNSNSNWITSNDTLADRLYADAGSIGGNIYADSMSIWEREDSAYQRMVEDMQKAGLNPWTGVSSGGSPTSSVNPSMDSLTGLIQVLGSWIDKNEASVRGLQGSTQAAENVISTFNKAVGLAGKFMV